jgi:hypothetical protein
MKDSTPQTLRGDAAWRAEMQEISKRNDAARAAGARRRAAKEALALQREAVMARRETQDLPKQPHPS